MKRIDEHTNLAIKAEIKKLRELGVKNKDIAKRLNISEYRVAVGLRELKSDGEIGELYTATENTEHVRLLKEDGYSNIQIAAILNICVSTVGNYIKDLKRENKL